MIIDKIVFFDEETGGDETKESSVFPTKKARKLFVQKAAEQSVEDDPQGVTVSVKGRLDGGADFVALPGGTGSGDIVYYDIDGIAEVRCDIVFDAITTGTATVTVIANLTD